MIKSSRFGNGLKDIYDSIPIKDNSLTSPKYFRLFDVPDKLYLGKNSFRINANTDNLASNALIYIDIIDSSGDIIYHDVPDFVGEDKSRLIIPHIYEDTPPGEATIIIASRASHDLNGNEVPYTSNDINSPNVVWYKRVVVVTNSENSSELIFKTPPVISVSQREDLSYGYNFNTTVDDRVKNVSGSLNLSLYSAKERFEQKEDFKTALQMDEEGDTISFNSIRSGSRVTSNQRVIPPYSDYTIVRNDAPIFTKDFKGGKLSLYDVDNLFEDETNIPQEVTFNIVDVIDSKTVKVDGTFNFSYIDGNGVNRIISKIKNINNANIEYLSDEFIELGPHPTGWEFSEFMKIVYESLLEVLNENGIFIDDTDLSNIIEFFTDDFFPQYNDSEAPGEFEGEMSLQAILDDLEDYIISIMSEVRTVTSTTVTDTELRDLINGVLELIMDELYYQEPRYITKTTSYVEVELNNIEPIAGSLDNVNISYKTYGSLGDFIDIGRYKITPQEYLVSSQLDFTSEGLSENQIGYFENVQDFEEYWSIGSGSINQTYDVGESVIFKDQGVVLFNTGNTNLEEGGDFYIIPQESYSIKAYEGTEFQISIDVNSVKPYENLQNQIDLLIVSDDDLVAERGIISDKSITEPKRHELSQLFTDKNVFHVNSKKFKFSDGTVKFTGNVKILTKSNFLPVIRFRNIKAIDVKSISVKPRNLLGYSPNQAKLIIPVEDLPTGNEILMRLDYYTRAGITSKSHTEINGLYFTGTTSGDPIVEPVQGLQGESVQGTQGLQGESVQGTQGLQGESVQGTQGLQGAQGLTGAIEEWGEIVNVSHGRATVVYTADIPVTANYVYIKGKAFITGMQLGMSYVSCAIEFLVSFYKIAGSSPDSWVGNITVTNFNGTHATNNWKEDIQITDLWLTGFIDSEGRLRIRLHNNISPSGGSVNVKVLINQRLWNQI